VRRALVSDVKAPMVWLTATFAQVGLVVGALGAAAVGLEDVALLAGFVATLAGVAGGLVPPSLTRQVAVPAAVAIALVPVLVLGVRVVRWCRAPLGLAGILGPRRIHPISRVMLARPMRLFREAFGVPGRISKGHANVRKLLLGLVK
jgi:hypothetical protein